MIYCAHALCSIKIWSVFKQVHFEICPSERMLWQTELIDAV